MKKKPFIMATCCLAGSLLVATPVYAAPTAGVSNIANLTLEEENESTAVAGVSRVLSQCLEQSVEEKDSSVEAVTSEDGKVASPVKSEYDDIAVAQVNDYVNIRSKANEDSEVVGKLYNNSVATVVKEKKGWYKITSGSVTGYVKSDYVVVGDAKLVKSVGKKIATVNTKTLKVRSDASADASVLSLVSEGEELKVKSTKTLKDGWVEVKANGDTGYVSADYVDVKREYTYAESKEEEEARLAAEKAKKEAEEAARAAEEAARNAAASNTSSTTSQSSEKASGSGNASGTGSASSSSSSNSTSSSGSKQSSDASSSSSESSSASSESSQGSSSGQAVVNYACQFVGNPYVYGGSSLTNGTDCSGFVMSVYAHFGVSLPHSSSALRGVGRGVSASEMQPGDIVCYSGHVAIYVGNNTVVHASNPESGIKYTSPANYRSIVAVRRIF